MEPRDRPLVCFASKIRLHEYNVGCCSNDDLCNKNMTLEFVPKAVDDDDALLEGAFLSLLFVGLGQSDRVIEKIRPMFVNVAKIVAKSSKHKLKAQNSYILLPLNVKISTTNKPSFQTTFLGKNGQLGSVTHQMAVPVPSISCCGLNHHNLFYQIHNALTFNWDKCCHLVLCLRLLPFH
jgi:hypothetical protein